MKILDVKSLPNGDEEFRIEVTEGEKKQIRAATGWERLTQRRLKWWFFEKIKKDRSSKKS